VLAEEIERMNDARLEMVAVTAVETSPNLRHAKVYIDILGPGKAADAMTALSKASRRLQQAIGRQVRMKFTPVLEFAIDPGVVAGERIDAILRDIEHDHGDDDE
jgi:ribosome-binding factor A